MELASESRAHTATAAGFTAEGLNSLASVGGHALSTRNFPEIAIEGTQRKMAGLACDLEQQSIGEPQARPLLKPIECSSHDLVILNGETLVIEEDF